MKHYLKIFASVSLALLTLHPIAKAEDTVKLRFDATRQFQTIHSFGASDCWSMLHFGEKWPLRKRNHVADLLFSTETDRKTGNPRGIGLTLWRYNIGAGSLEIGDRSGIANYLRRTECYLDENGKWDWSKQKGPRWFIDAARKRGVRYVLGFSISAPPFMTRNGMCRATKGDFPEINLREDKFDDYAKFMAEVCRKLSLDYLSPINEPQWDWSGTGQEGTPATNENCYRLIKALDKYLAGSKTKIVFGEAADIRYLYRQTNDKPRRDNQIEELFRPGSPTSILKFSSVAPVVTGHSYWSTFPIDTMIRTRKELARQIETGLPPEVTYWQTEYCPMEKNRDNPQGGRGRDLGMNTALYFLRVLHHDLTVCNASSWQTWTSLSEWNYKDALIYIDDGIHPAGADSFKDEIIRNWQHDGVIRPSKYLWALGNFSRFVRPGMIRIARTDAPDYSKRQAYGLMASAFVSPDDKQVTIVLINFGKNAISVEPAIDNLGTQPGPWRTYITSETKNLEFTGFTTDSVVIPARSVVTLTTTDRP